VEGDFATGSLPKGRFPEAKSLSSELRRAFKEV